LDIESLIKEESVKTGVPAYVIRNNMRTQLNRSFGKKERVKSFSDDEKVAVKEWAQNDVSISQMMENTGKSRAQINGLLLHLGIQGLRY